MKLVVYLSGERGRTIGWHQTRDTVAASSSFKGKLDERIRYLLVSSACACRLDGEPVDEIPSKFKSTDLPLYCSPDCLADLASDLSENGGDDAEIAELIQYVTGCEAICGDVYLVGSRS
jgi:hypothetical protein